MKNLVHKIPFLRISVALATGIVLGPLVETDICVLVPALVFLIVMLIWLEHRYSYRLAAVFGIAVHIFFIVTGIFFFRMYNQKPVFYQDGTFLATVTAIMEEKANSFTTELDLYAVTGNDSIRRTREKVIAYFTKSEDAESLLPGQTVVFSAAPHMIRNNGNPFEFDYKKYLSRQKIFRQVYLPSGSWITIRENVDSNLQIKAERCRSFLLDVYKNYDIGERESDILAAMTLGYRKGLDPDTRRIFTSAGTMHVLAVSGLHVGIVFMVFSILFNFLKRYRPGRFLFVLLAIAGLWSFAFITGLSPSVKRAAAMFSLILIGQNLSRQTNIYNMLAASAFFILLFNPNNLFEAGFQLSYAAVFGIVFLQPRLENLLQVKPRVLHYLWMLFTVSVAAQVATLPIILFYFHQFPFYFWISNLFIIPVVTVIIFLGMGLLAFNSVPFISALLAALTGFTLKAVVAFLELIEKFPFAVIKTGISGSGIMMLSGMLICLFLFLEYRQKWQVRGFIVFCFLLAAASFIQVLQHGLQKEIIGYNHPAGKVIHLIAGKKNYIISEKQLPADLMNGIIIQNTLLHLGLKQPVYLTFDSTFEDSNVLLRDRCLYFNHRLMSPDRRSLMMLTQILPVDEVILVQRKYDDPEDGFTVLNLKIESGDNPKSRIHCLGDDGAYREKLNM